MNSEQSSADKEPLMHRLLVGFVSLVCQFPWLVLVASLGLAGVSVYAFYVKLEYRTQRRDLIDAHKESQQRWQKYLDEFGDDDDMVVVVKGSDKRRMKDALD